MSQDRTQPLWNHLHWLVTLAQQGSYTAAAARLGVSKAAMSQHIADLERMAGVPLVIRTTRSVRLTETGQRLVDATRPAFESIAQSFSGVREQAGRPQGLIRVTAPVALARQQLVQRLAGFLEANPEVRIELELSDRVAALAREGFDLAIRHTDVIPDTHVAWTLCPTRAVLVASRRYLERRGAPARPEELQAHRCLHYPRSNETATWSFEPPGRRRLPAQRVTVPIQGPLAATNSEALRDAALADLGIALLPDFSAQAALRSGELVQVLARWQHVGTFARSVHALRPYSPHVPLAVVALVQHLRHSLAGGFPLKPLL